MFTNFQRKSMMTRTARERFSRRPEDTEMINGQAVRDQSFQHPAYDQHYAAGYQEQRDYYFWQNQRNRYHEQFPQYPSQYENYTFIDHRQRPYQDNKENKNSRDNLDYYMDKRSRGQAFDSDNERHSNSPYNSRYDRRREDSFRSSPQTKHSNSQRYHSAVKSSRCYRSRSPRRPSSRSPARRRKRSRKKRERSRSKSSPTRSVSVTSETSDGSVRRNVSSKKRKAQQRDESPEKGHSSEKRKKRPMSVVKKVQNRFKSTVRRPFDRTRYTWKKHEPKVEMKIGDLAMSPISSDDFSQRSEEAECEADREDNDESKTHGNNELAGKNSEEIQNEQNENKDTPENKPTTEYKEERNVSDEMISESVEINDTSDSDKQGLRKISYNNGCLHESREHMKDKECGYINSVPKMMRKTEGEVSESIIDDLISREKQPKLIPKNRIATGKTLPSNPDKKEDNKAETEPDEVGIFERKQKGSVEELKETLLKTKSIGSEMVDKIVSLVAKKSTNDNASELSLNDTQDNGRKATENVGEVGEVGESTNNDKERKLISSKNDKHEQSSKNGIWKQSKICNDKIEVSDGTNGNDNLTEEKERKNSVDESENEQTNGENVHKNLEKVPGKNDEEKSEKHKESCNEDKHLIKESNIIPDESLKDQKLTQTLVTSTNGKEISVDKGIRYNLKQKILKEYDPVASGLLNKNSRSQIKSRSGEQDNTNQGHDGQNLLQVEVDRTLDRPVSPELKESPPPYTSQSSVQNKNYYFSGGPSVISPGEQNVGLGNTGQGDNLTNNFCRFQEQNSDKNERADKSAFSPTDILKSRSLKLSLTEKKKYQYSEVHMKQKENGKCREWLNVDKCEEVDKGSYPPDKRSNLNQMSDSVREKRPSEVTGTVTGTSSRKRHASESTSPNIKKGTINRPSDEVFIPLGKPFEKKYKLTPTIQVPDIENNVLHDLAGPKTEVKPNHLKEKDSNKFAGIKDAVAEIDLNSCARNTLTELKTDTEQKKSLFSKNKRRISHFSSMDKSVVQNSKFGKTLNANEPNSSASKPRTHPFKQVPVKKCSYPNSVRDKMNLAKETNASKELRSSAHISNSNTKHPEVEQKQSLLDNIFEKMKETKLIRTEQERKSDKKSESITKKINTERNLIQNRNERGKKTDETIYKGNNAVHSKEVEEPKLEKSKHQIQKGVLRKEPKHGNIESRDNIRKQIVEECDGLKLHKSDTQELKPEGFAFVQNACKRFGKSQTSKEYSPGDFESKKETNAQTNCGRDSIDVNKRLSTSSVNRNKDHSEEKVDKFKDNNDKSDSADLKNENVPTMLFSENTGIISADVGGDSQKFETRKVDSHLQNKMKINNDKKLTQFIGNKNLIRNTSPQDDVAENKRQDVKKIEGRKQVLKKKPNADIEHIKSKHHINTSEITANKSGDERENTQNDNEIQRHTEIKGKITVNNIQMHNDSAKENTENEMDIQNAAKRNLKIENGNILQDEKKEKGMHDIVKYKETYEEKELQTASQNNEEDTNIQNISEAVETIKEISNDSENGKTNFDLIEKPASNTKFIEMQSDTNIQSQIVNDNANDCDSEMDDIEPIEMIGSVFINDINMNESSEDILNYHVAAESSETDFKIDYCDDSVLFKTKKQGIISENMEAEKVLEHDRGHKSDLSKERTDRNLVRQDMSEYVIQDVLNENKSKVGEVISGHSENECDESNKNNLESSKIKVSTLKSPNRPDKKTPRKRFSAQLETLGKLIEGEKEIEIEALAYNEKAKTQVPGLKHISNTEPECSDNDDDTELITSVVELTQTKPVDSPVTKSSEWLKKAKSNVKVPSNLTKPETQRESDHGSSVIDIIPDMPQTNETFSKKIFDNGFILSHRKVLLNGDFHNTFARLLPKKLYKTTCQEKKKNLGKCLQCQTCSMFFSPLNFTVHHDTNSVVEQIDTDRSILERYCLTEKGDSDTHKILKDFLTYFISERSKRTNTSPVKLPLTIAPTVEEEDLLEEDLPVARKKLPQDATRKNFEDSDIEKPGLSQQAHKEVESGMSQCAPVRSHSSNKVSSKHGNANTPVKSLNDASNCEVIFTTSSTVLGTHAGYQMTSQITNCDKSESFPQSRSDNHMVPQAAGQVAPKESVIGKPSLPARLINGNEKTQNQFGNQSTSVSTDVTPSHEHNVSDRVNASVADTNLASLQSYSIQCRYPTSAQQFQPVNTCEMSMQTAQNKSVQQFQITCTKNTHHQQKSQQYLQHGNENLLSTSPVSEQNSVHHLLPEMVQNSAYKQRQSLINQGMCQSQQFQPHVAKWTDRQTLQQRQRGMNYAAQAKSSHQSTAYQQSPNYDFQGNQQNYTSKQGSSVTNGKVSHTGTTKSKGNVTLSSQNLANVPMFNPLTAPLMNQNTSMPSAISTVQAGTSYQSKPYVNRSDYTGIPFAVTQSQGLPVVISEYGQSSNQTASTSNVMTQNVNYTKAFEQIEMPGVQEPVRPGQETSLSSAVISRQMSDSATQGINEASVEEERQKLYRALCALDNINTGDVGLDIMLLAEKSYLRGMTLIDKDIVRLTEESCDAIIQQCQQRTHPGRGRQSIEERANYLGQLKRNPR